MNAQFRLTVRTEESSLFFETMPPMPAPRVGEDVFVPDGGYGETRGFWRVTEVTWILPSKGAMEPTFEVMLRVEWSPVNERSAPTYDEDRGWVRPDE